MHASKCFYVYLCSLYKSCRTNGLANTFFSRKCDKKNCSLVSPLWRIFTCGHSFHCQCNFPNVCECPVSKDALKNKIDLLAKRANSAVNESGDDDVIANDDVSDFK